MEALINNIKSSALLTGFVTLILFIMILQYIKTSPHNEDFDSFFYANHSLLTAYNVNQLFQWEPAGKQFSYNIFVSFINL